MATQQAERVDFLTALAATQAGAKPKAKKGTAPTLAIPADVQVAVDEYQEAKELKKRAEAVMEAAGSTIIGWAQETQDRDGFAGRFSNSYNLVGQKHSAKVVYSNRYSINPADEAELARILGNRFGEMVVKRVAVTIREEALADRKFVDLLMKKFGDKLGEYFEMKTTLEVAEGFNKMVYAAVKPEDLDELRLYAKQYKPSIR